ncbi:MAG: outer membrane protein assembly factor BamD [Flavobacteriales bacterium]
MRVLFYICSLTLLLSCSGYQKVLKSNDVELKYEMAKKYYDDTEYFKALPLLDELHLLYKGTNRAEEVDYLLAYTHYGLGANMLASYYFKIFTLTYPNSKHVEELSFMSAYCYYLESPSSTLDKTNTLKAISELQSFIDRYPESKRVSECNELIDNLTVKVHVKAFKIAKLYHDIEDYKAAITALNNLIIDYPTIENQQEILYLILQSNYQLAINSIQSKKEERFNNTIAAFNYFKNNNTNEKLLNDAQNIYDKTLKQLQKFQ